MNSTRICILATLAFSLGGAAEAHTISSCFRTQGASVTYSGIQYFTYNTNSSTGSWTPSTATQNITVSPGIPFYLRADDSYTSSECDMVGGKPVAKLDTEGALSWDLDASSGILGAESELWMYFELTAPETYNSSLTRSGSGTGQTRLELERESVPGVWVSVFHLQPTTPLTLADGPRVLNPGNYRLHFKFDMAMAPTTYTSGSQNLIFDGSFN